MFIFALIQYFSIFQEFLKFLKDNDGQHILDEGLRLNTLRTPTMKKLTELMVEFMIQNFTLHASEFHIRQICIACVNVVPCIRTPNSTIGGIV